MKKWDLGIYDYHAGTRSLVSAIYSNRNFNWGIYLIIIDVYMIKLVTMGFSY